jgi:DNA polymerase-3 subunit alpha
MTYIPLNVHSHYSILNSTASVAALAEKAKSFGVSALALTDDGNLYGAVEFYKACKAAGVKPILGCEIWMAPTSRLEKKRIPGMSNGIPITLLAKNKEGYRNLCKLSSIGFLEGFYYQPRIDKEVLSAHKEGLLCLSQSAADVVWYLELFGPDFYLEIRRHPFSDDGVQEGWLLQKMREYSESQGKANEELIALARQHGIGLVATNNIHYIERDDWRAHEILLNIQSGEPCEIWERDSAGNPKNKAPNPKRETTSTHELYFKSPAEMQALFADLPEAIENTVKVAEQCRCELDFKTKHYPVFIPPDLVGKKVTKDERRQEVEDGDVAAAREVRERPLGRVGRRLRELERVWEDHEEQRDRARLAPRLDGLELGQGERPGLAHALRFGLEDEVIGREPIRVRPRQRAVLP